MCVCVCVCGISNNKIITIYVSANILSFNMSHLHAVNYYSTPRFLTGKKARAQLCHGYQPYRNIDSVVSLVSHEYLQPLPDTFLSDCT